MCNISTDVFFPLHVRPLRSFPLCSLLFFHLRPTAVLIWLVRSVIISAQLMSQKAGLITAQQFCKWLVGVWEREWETFKGVCYVRAKENDRNSTWVVKQRQSLEVIPDPRLYMGFDWIIWACWNSDSFFTFGSIMCDNLVKAKSRRKWKFNLWGRGLFY